MIPDFEIRVEQELDITGTQTRVGVVTVTADTVEAAVARVEQLLKEDDELKELIDHSDWDFGLLRACYEL